MLAQPHEAVASGAVASFRTDVVSALPMEFDLVPIQDLHGQANPYPAGGGKNKLNSNTVSTGYIRGTDGAHIGSSSWNCSEEYSEILPNTNYVLYKYTTGSSSVAGYALYDENKQYISGAEYGSQSSVSITTPNNAKYIRASWNKSATNPVALMLSTELDTTYAPYSNLCPITGHDGFTRNGAGINLWDGETESGYYDVNHNGAKVDSATWKRSKNPIPCLPSTNIYFYNEGQTTSGFGALLFFDMYGNQISYKTSGVKNSVVTTPANAKTMAFYAKEEWIGNISVNYPASDTAYHAYQGTSIHTTFPTPPGTVYGCHVRDNGDGTGTLAVTDVSVDLGTLSWTVPSSGRVSSLGINSVVKKPTLNSDVAEIICSTYKVQSRNGLSDKGIAVNNSGNVIVEDSSLTDGMTQAQVATALTGVQLVYKLAEPVTYTLSLDAIQSLIGQNNVWVDNADSVSVEYWGH